jgi:hypothetical protein
LGLPQLAAVVVVATKEQGMLRAFLSVKLSEVRLFHAADGTDDRFFIGNPPILGVTNSNKIKAIRTAAEM